MSAFISGVSIDKLRRMEYEMARRCDDLLTSTPVGTDLVDTDDMSGVVDLIVTGTYAPGALSAVVTKVLHRKRPHLIPILDSAMVRTYRSEREARILSDSYASESTCRSGTTAALSAIQADVRAAGEGWPVGTLRVHDILVWEREGGAGVLPRSGSAAKF